jgi:hypothetical protein
MLGCRVIPITRRVSVQVAKALIGTERLERLRVKNNFSKVLSATRQSNRTVPKIGEYMSLNPFSDELEEQTILEKLYELTNRIDSIDVQDFGQQIIALKTNILSIHRSTIANRIRIDSLWLIYWLDTSQRVSPELSESVDGCIMSMRELAHLTLGRLESSSDPETIARQWETRHRQLLERYGFQHFDPAYDQEAEHEEKAT